MNCKQENSKKTLNVFKNNKLNNQTSAIQQNQLSKKKSMMQQEKKEKNFINSTYF